MRLPSPAMVVASVALGVALSGTGYAAVKLTKNSVGATQIRTAAVRSSEVKDRSLRARDFARGQLPRGATGVAGAIGPTGPAGPAGPAGATGPSALEVVVPAARATLPGDDAQTVPDNTAVKLALTTESYDTAGMHSGGTFTAPRTGLYLVEGFARWFHNTSGVRQIVVHAGSDYASETTMQATTPVLAPTTTSVSAVVKLVQGQTAQLEVQQSSGGSVPIIGAGGLDDVPGEDRLRVVAGRFGGRRLTAPPGRGTRPTSDRVREALFSILGPLEDERRARPLRGVGRARHRGALARRPAGGVRRAATRARRRR